ncbi:MAG: hypothetical protein KDM64_01085 [Verrucomicrobiae bacterium]|nr:hypothetical protein [Verrucomicrobiae bacterium]
MWSLIFFVCLAALFSVGCAGVGRTTSPPPASKTGGDELVEEARQISAKDGLLEARDFLTIKLAERDDSNGAMERRFERASTDKEFVYPDSLAALPLAERKRIGIAFIPGMRAKAGKEESKPVAALRAAAKETEKLGMDAKLIPAIGRGDVDKNAAAMAESIREVFERNDKVILLAKSKGAHDLIYFLRNQGAAFPEAQRQKLCGVCILAGTVQGSYVADWFSRNWNPWAIGARASLLLTGKGGQISMLKSVADSPWIGVTNGFPLDTYPNLTWINLAVLPEGEDGRASGKEWSKFYSDHIQKTNGWESPSDSLVETAAEVLPGSIDVPEWIIRVRGNHAFPSGRFLDGAPITPNTKPLEDGMNPAAGGEIMDAFLRSLPASILR